jgi:hypothetical protein
MTALFERAPFGISRPAPLVIRAPSVICAPFGDFAPLGIARLSGVAPFIARVLTTMPSDPTLNELG